MLARACDTHVRDHVAIVVELQIKMSSLSTEFSCEYRTA